MGWRGTVRSINATMNKIERESKKRERELEKRRQNYEKMQELERASFEVEEFDNYIERIKSIHKECSEPINWKDVINADIPDKPIFDKKEILALKKELDNYKGTFFQKLFNSIEKNKLKLKEKIVSLEKEEKLKYQNSLKDYDLLLIEIENNKADAKKILEEDETTIINVIKEFSPFDEIDNLGTKISFTFIDKKLHIVVNVLSNKIIPLEVKTLLKSGKISIKKMTKSNYNELYQDYVCSVVLRIAREIFALVPINEIVITAKDEMLDSKTGYKNLEIILSVFIVRNTIESLNLNNIDPSDSMQNFIHNMNFKKTTGFSSVKQVVIN